MDQLKALSVAAGLQAALDDSFVVSIQQSDDGDRWVVIVDTDTKENQ